MTIDEQVKKLKDLRGLLGMSLRDFSAYCEIPFDTMRGWERGKSKAPDYIIIMLEASIYQEMLSDNKNNRLMAYMKEMSKSNLNRIREEMQGGSEDEEG